MDQALRFLEAAFMDSTGARVSTGSVQEELITLPLASLTVLTLETEKPPPCKGKETAGKKPSCSLPTMARRFKMLYIP